MMHNFELLYKRENDFLILAIDPKISSPSYVFLLNNIGIELSDTGHPQPGVDYNTYRGGRYVRITGVDDIWSGI